MRRRAGSVTFAATIAGAGAVAGALVLSLLSPVGPVGAQPASPSQETEQAPSYCSQAASRCAEPLTSIGYDGAYTGHDEPSNLFYSGVAGSGNNDLYRLTLPKDPLVPPSQDGKGGTANFQLHPAFWVGMAMCDTQSAPEFMRNCTPDSDNNIFASSDPASSRYIGRHPGTAFMEMQFYPPGWVKQFNGPSCDPNKWCAALTIDSFLENMNTGQFNNSDCRNNYFLVGDEPVNFAYITKNGVSQAPANPLALSTDPKQIGLTPDPAKDLFMNSGDQLAIHLQDTPAGLRIDISDQTTGGTGSMTTSTSNGFGQIVYDPTATKCSVRPYPFHPMYSTSSTATRVPWAAHTYNTAFADEIGHFEYCGAVSHGGCLSGVTDPHGTDVDDQACFPASLSLKYPIGGCAGADIDFDGPEYTPTWPGSVANPTVRANDEATPIQFTSPLFNGHEQYSQVAFEANMPRIESAVGCQYQTTGAGCVNPPPGTSFYPFFTTTTDAAGGCVWQEGGPFIPGTTNTFGGSSAAEFGNTLFQNSYPGPGFKPIFKYEDFRHILSNNPCTATG